MRLLQILHLVLLLAACGWSGSAIVAALNAGASRRSDRWAFGLIWAPLFLALTALILADCGLFRIKLVDLCAAVWLLIGIFAERRLRAAPAQTVVPGAPAAPAPTPPQPRAARFFPLLVLALAAGLFLRPFQYLHGGWDPGEYVCTAANISRTGSLTIRDELLPGLSQQEREAFLHQPKGDRRTVQAGYLLNAEDGSRIVPDYYHLYPGWLAIFHALFGLYGTYYGQYLIAVCATLLFFLTIRAMFEPLSALLAGLILLVSPAQLYFGRFPTTELLTQFLVFAIFFALARGTKRGMLGCELTAAAAAAAALLTRAPIAIVIAAVVVLLLLRALMARSLPSLRAALLLGAAAGLALARNALRARTMTRFLLDLARVHLQSFPRGALIAGVILLCLAPGMLWLSRRRYGSDIPAWLGRWLPATAVAAAGLFLYFLRPRLFPGEQARNLVLVGWLVSPVTLVAATAFFFRRAWPDWPARHWLFVFPGLAAATVFIAHKMIYPLLMWAARRYVPIVLPLLAALAGVVLADGLRHPARRRRWAAALLLAAALGYELWQSVPTLCVRDHAGLPGFCMRVARHMRDADLVVCDHWKYATPLRYAFGLPTYQLSRMETARGVREANLVTRVMRRAVRQGARVYYVTVDGPFFDPEFRLEHVGSEHSAAHVLQARKAGLPRHRVSTEERAEVYALRGRNQTASVPAAAHELDIGYHALGLIHGWHEMTRRHGRGFRWTKGRGCLYLPVYPETDTDWIFHLASRRPGQTNTAVKVLGNGRCLATVLVGREWADYTVRIPAGTFTASTVHASLECETWNPAAFGIYGYPRDLGVRVDRIRAARVAPRESVSSAEQSALTAGRAGGNARVTRDR